MFQPVRRWVGVGRDSQPCEQGQVACTNCISYAGELSSLEEVVAQMLIHQPPLLKPPVIQAIWQCLGSSQSLLDSKVADLDCGCALISMIAAKQPETVVDNLSLLLKASCRH